MKTGMNKMIKYNSSIGYTLLCLFIVLQIIACGKMDANYADFIKDGEIVYTGRAEALTSYPGKNRVKLSWLLVSDPKVKLCKVFWNNKTDSLAIPVQKTGKTDTIQTIISNLNEGLYAFQVYTYDDEGHTSVKSEVPGVSYGASYAGSIFNRSLKSVKKAPNGKDIWLEWFGAAQQTAAVQVNISIPTDNRLALCIQSGSTTWGDQEVFRIPIPSITIKMVRPSITARVFCRAMELLIHFILPLKM